jgi:hypothetical protein
MAGEVASLLLSRMTVPILYYLSERKRQMTLVPEAGQPVDVEKREEPVGEATAIGASGD